MPTSYISQIFGSSPVRPLQKHMQRVLKCVDQLPPFLADVYAGNTEQRDKRNFKIIKFEQQADELKKELRLHLPVSLFMPVDRRDVLEVLAMQDKVAGGARNIAGLFVMRNLAMPAALADDYAAFLQRCVDACHQAHRAISEMDELIETGFGKTEIERISTLLDGLDAIERETDTQQFELERSLMSMEKDLPPVEVMFLYQLWEITGNLADRAQRVGSRFQLMLAR